MVKPGGKARIYKKNPRSNPRLNPRPDAQIRAPYGAEWRGIAHNYDPTRVPANSQNPRTIRAISARNPRAAYSASRPDGRAARLPGQVNLLHQLDCVDAAD